MFGAHPQELNENYELDLVNKDLDHIESVLKLGWREFQMP